MGQVGPERRVILDREAEERPVPRSGDGTLGCVDLQLEASFDEAGQARHDPPAGPFAADVDVTVIRVSHEPVAAALKLSIQFIQHEIREQGGINRRFVVPRPAADHRDPGLLSSKVNRRRSS